jgi:hypothetical protein
VSKWEDDYKCLSGKDKEEISHDFFLGAITAFA